MGALVVFKACIVAHDEPTGGQGMDDQIVRRMDMELILRKAQDELYEKRELEFGPRGTTMLAAVDRVNYSVNLVLVLSPRQERLALTIEMVKQAPALLDALTRMIWVAKDLEAAAALDLHVHPDGLGCSEECKQRAQERRDYVRKVFADARRAVELATEGKFKPKLEVVRG